MRRLTGMLAVAFLVNAAAAHANTVTVDVGGGNGFQFVQPQVTVHVGDTVHWVWVSGTHTVTSGSNGTPSGLFDTGGHSNGFTFHYTFTAPGVFKYYCTYHYASPLNMVGSVTVLGSSTPPTASFSFSPPNPLAAQTVTFDASGSKASAGNTIASYQWSFGDGTSQTTSGATISHVYGVAGTYQATLIAVDSQGNKSQPVSETITIRAPNPDTSPVARLTAPSTATTGQAVSLDGSASSDADGDAITSYRWSFGDGATQTTSTPVVTHVYGSAGSFSAQLTVLDSRGNASSPASRAVDVRAATVSVTGLRATVRRRLRLTFTASGPAELTLTIRRRHHHRVLRRRSFAAHQGKNRLTLRLHRLAPGRYVLSVKPAGGRPVTARFRLRKR